MNDLRTAAQQALEALDGLYLPGELERVNAAITALRAALAEPAAPQGEPACTHVRSSGPADRATHWCALAATPPAAPSAPITYTYTVMQQHVKKDQVVYTVKVPGWPWIACGNEADAVSVARRLGLHAAPSVPAEWDSIALQAAQEIALMWGQDRSQFVSKIQVRILDAMLAVLDPPAASSVPHRLVSDAEYLRLFEDARKGSDKPSGRLRGIRACIAAYEAATPNAPPASPSVPVEIATSADAKSDALEKAGEAYSNAAPQGEPVAIVCESPQTLTITGGAIVRWAQPLADALPPGTKLYASPPASPPAVPSVPAPVIAGALFDFLGWLTSRDEVTTLHSRADAGVAVRVLEQWAALRGLSLDDARVRDWQLPGEPSGEEKER